MPLYHFHCGDCGRDFSLAFEQQEDEDRPHRCPNCQSDHVERAEAAEPAASTSGRG